MRAVLVLAVLVCALMAATDSRWVKHNKRTTETCSCDCSTTLAAACVNTTGFSLYTDADGAEVCIMVPDNTKTYSKAFDVCDDYDNGRLFKTDTVAKMNLLRDYSNKTNIFIGLDDRETSDKFMWSDGTELDMDSDLKTALFIEGEPKGKTGFYDVECVEWKWNTDSDYGLNDRRCDAAWGYACEIHSATVTENITATNESCACSCDAFVQCAANGEGYTLVTDATGSESCLSPLAVECAALVGYTLVTDDAGEESCLSPLAVECATIQGYTLVTDNAGESCLSPLAVTCGENVGFTLFTDGNGTEVCLKVSGDNGNYNDAKRAVKSTEDETDTKRAVRTLLKMLKEYV